MCVMHLHIHKRDIYAAALYLIQYVPRMEWQYLWINIIK